MKKRMLRPSLLVALMLVAMLIVSSVASTALAQLKAGISAATPTCDAAGMSTDPATTPISSDLNAAGCVLDGAQVQTPPPDVPPDRQPVNPLQPPPDPGYHHVGTWNADVVAERATVHSSQLFGVQTRAGECFWRTSHLVFWGDQAYWVESGLFKCSDGPYKIFVYIGWGDGSPGYVIPDFDVPEGATVTTFAEWECVDNTNLVSGGYFNENDEKVYLIQYDTGTSPCVQSNQTDNNGEAYTVQRGRKAHFLVDKYTALNTQICDKDESGNWDCVPWDTDFATTTVEQLDTYDVHWYTDSEGNPTYYYDWFGHGHEEGEAGGDSNDAPVVSIISPTDGSTFQFEATILFEGTASDTEDGDLTASLVWTSSTDGEIGTGGSFSTTLSDGDHIIEASVTDSGGKTGSDSIGITVGDLQTPQTLSVTIALSDAPYKRGEPVYITATVTDGTNGVGGATAHITMLTPKPISYGWDQTTDENGVTVFEFTPKWSGEYTTWVDASKEGYDSGSSKQITFTVN